MTPTARRRWSTIVGTSFAITVLATATLVLAYVTGAHISAGWIVVPIIAHLAFIVVGIIAIGIYAFVTTFARRFAHNLRT